MPDATAHTAFIARSAHDLWVLIRRVILACFLTFPLLSTGPCLASEPIPSSESSPNPSLHWKGQGKKSYVIPALEIPAFVLLLNAVDRHLYSDEIEEGKKEYGSTLSTTLENLVHGRWGQDDDKFSMNQLLHPYQGLVFHGIGRSSGLNFWESSGAAIAGSFLWEVYGETPPPAMNDLLSSGIGGSFLGESLFRMASLLLESSDGKPSFWREAGAALLSPPLGFNRLVFGDRRQPLFPGRDPAIMLRLRAGMNLNTKIDRRFGTTDSRNAAAEWIMDYGLPGKPGYSHTRPFDTFHASLSVNDREDAVESVMIHGLLWGKSTEKGASYRSVWGLYGGYDYLSPVADNFRVSTTSLSLGTTFQWWLSQKVALQGTILGGIGYGAGGLVAGKGDRDYHYGMVPQGQVALRLLIGDRAMLDLSGHEFYISSRGASEPGKENILRLNAGLTVRLFDRHALGLRYVISNRDLDYPGIAERHQTMGCLGIFYTYLTDTGFGAVEWREGK
jgi:hypothetical protein